MLSLCIIFKKYLNRTKYKLLFLTSEDNFRACFVWVRICSFRMYTAFQFSYCICVHACVWKSWSMNVKDRPWEWVLTLHPPCGSVDRRLIWRAVSQAPDRNFLSHFIMAANKRTGDTIDDVEVGALVARSQAFHPLKGSKQIVTDKLPPF